MHTQKFILIGGKYEQHYFLLSIFPSHKLNHAVFNKKQIFFFSFGDSFNLTIFPNGWLFFFYPIHHNNVIMLFFKNMGISLNPCRYPHSFFQLNLTRFSLTLLKYITLCLQRTPNNVH